MSDQNRRPVSERELIDMGRFPREVFSKEMYGKQDPWITQHVMDLRVGILLKDFLGEDILKREVDEVVIVGVAEGGIHFLNKIATFIENELNENRTCGHVIRTSWKTLRVRSTHNKVSQNGPQLTNLPLDLEEIRGRFVILVDDIADTGETLKTVTAELKKHDPADIVSVVCLCKAWTKFAPQYAAFLIPNHVIAVGWGMDAGMGVGRANNAIWDIASYIRRKGWYDLIDGHLIRWAQEVGNQALLDLVAELKRKGIHVPCSKRAS